MNPSNKIKCPPGIPKILYLTKIGKREITVTLTLTLDHQNLIKSSLSPWTFVQKFPQGVSEISYSPDWDRWM